MQNHNIYKGTMVIKVLTHHLTMKKVPPPHSTSLMFKESIKFI